MIGGVAGYGTGALMPLVLVPMIGAEPVVPIIALSALFTNASRAVHMSILDAVVGFGGAAMLCGAFVR